MTPRQKSRTAARLPFLPLAATFAQPDSGTTVVSDVQRGDNPDVHATEGLPN